MRLVAPRGLVPLQEAIQLQERCARMWPAEGAAIVVQHPPVYSLGRKAWAADAQALPHPAVRVSRGGGAVFHGPGQLAVYVVRRLSGGGGLLQAHAGDLLAVLEHAARRLGAPLAAAAGGDFGTGLFTADGRKAAFVGFGLAAGWSTRHGAALNVCADLSAFAHVAVCGCPVRPAPVANVGGSILAAEEALVDGLRRVYGDLLPAACPILPPRGGVE